MDNLFLALAAAEAARFEGATQPNPPVGACLVRDGKLLAVAAHERAGRDHAEITVLRAAAAKGASPRGTTLYVTLEPCNHHGKTPPCTQAILEAGIRRVVFGAVDPNSNVTGGGAAALRAAGIEICHAASSEACAKLIAPFRKCSLKGLPWVVHKRAYRFGEDGAPTMIPKTGSRAFTSPESLAAAHVERRRSDAILTGMGTVLADRPSFNVRHVQDHAEKLRWIAVVSANGRPLPHDWLERQRSLGNEAVPYRDPLSALRDLAARGALRVLVEAGPSLSEWFAPEGRWDERITIFHHPQGDKIVREAACSRES